MPGGDMLRHTAKTAWQQLSDGGVQRDIPVCVDANDANVVSEFGENLSAGSAWSATIFGADRHGHHLFFPAGDRRSHSAAFGTNREPVGRVLDIATGKNGAIIGLECRAYLIVRIGGVGATPDCGGGVDEVFEIEIWGKSHPGIVSSTADDAVCGAESAMAITSANRTDIRSAVAGSSIL